MGGGSGERKGCKREMSSLGCLILGKSILTVAQTVGLVLDRQSGFVVGSIFYMSFAGSADAHV